MKQLILSVISLLFIVCQNTFATTPNVSPLEVVELPNADRELASGAVTAQVLSEDPNAGLIYVETDDTHQPVLLKVNNFRAHPPGKFVCWATDLYTDRPICTWVEDETKRVGPWNGCVGHVRCPYIGWDL